jgi:hypothetical protein
MKQPGYLPLDAEEKPVETGRRKKAKVDVAFRGKKGDALMLILQRVNQDLRRF